MHLGQVEDLEFDPGSFAANGGIVEGDPSLTGKHGPTVTLKIDPATAAMLAAEFGPSVVVGDDVSITPEIEFVETDKKLSLVAVGLGVVIVGGALWYFTG